MIMSKVRIAGGVISPPNRTIMVHVRADGTVCPMSGARVGSLVFTCPMGCHPEVNMIIRDQPALSASDVAGALHAILGEREHLLVNAIDGVESVEVTGHSERLDQLMITVDGGVKIFRLIVEEVR